MIIGIVIFERVGQARGIDDRTIRPSEPELYLKPRLIPVQDKQGFGHRVVDRNFVSLLGRWVRYLTFFSQKPLSSLALTLHVLVRAAKIKEHICLGKAIGRQGAAHIHVIVVCRSTGRSRDGLHQQFVRTRTECNSHHRTTRSQHSGLHISPHQWRVLHPI